MHLLVWQLNVLPDRASSFQPAVNTPALVGPAETESSAARKTRRCCVRLFVHQTLLMSLTRSKPQLCLFFGGESLSGSLPVVLIGVVEGFAEELLSVVYTIAQTRGHDQTSDKHRLLVFRIQDKPFFSRGWENLVMLAGPVSDLIQDTAHYFFNETAALALHTRWTCYLNWTSWIIFHTPVPVATTGINNYFHSW